MKKSIVIGFLMLISILWGANADCECKGLLKKAEKFLTNGKYEEGINILYDYVKHDEYLYRDKAYMLLARNLHNGDEAVVYWKKIVTEYPKSDYYSNALYHIAQYYYIKGNYKKAAKTYEMLIKNQKLINGYMYYAAIYGCGISYKFANQYEKAKEYFLSIDVIKNKKHFFVMEGKTALADIYLQEHEYDKAVDIYKYLLTVVENDEKKAPLFLRLGMLYEAEFKNNEALKYFNKVISKYPNTLSYKVAKEHIANIKNAQVNKSDQIKYYVRLGMFRNYKNVKRLENYIESKNFDYLEKKRGKLKILLVGPFTTLGEAVKIKKLFDKKFNINSKIEPE